MREASARADDRGMSAEGARRRRSGHHGPIRRPLGVAGLVVLVVAGMVGAWSMERSPAVAEKVAARRSGGAYTRALAAFRALQLPQKLPLTWQPHSCARRITSAVQRARSLRAELIPLFAHALSDESLMVRGCPGAPLCRAIVDAEFDGFPVNGILTWHWIDEPNEHKPPGALADPRNPRVFYKGSYLTLGLETS